MVKRVDNLEDLADIIDKKMPAEVVLDLEGTALNVGHYHNDQLDDARWFNSPLFHLYEDSNKDYCMDITDSGEDNYSIKGLKPTSTKYEKPKLPSYGERGDLKIDLKGDEWLGLSHYRIFQKG